MPQDSPWSHHTAVGPPLGLGETQRSRIFPLVTAASLVVIACRYLLHFVLPAHFQDRLQEAQVLPGSGGPICSLPPIIAVYLFTKPGPDRTRQARMRPDQDKTRTTTGCLPRGAQVEEAGPSLSLCFPLVSATHNCPLEPPNVLPLSTHPFIHSLSIYPSVHPSIHTSSFLSSAPSLIYLCT